MQTKKIIDEIRNSDNPYELINNNFSPEDLVKILLYLKKQYFNNKGNYVKDEIYDIIEAKVAANGANEANEVGATPQKNKIKNKYWLGSLDKIKDNTKVLLSWFNKNKDEKFIVSDKLDGISSLLIYENNQQIMITRGDGSIGSTINTAIINHFNLPKANSIPINVLGFRGEIVMKEEKYKLLSSKFKSSTSRNTVSGVVNCNNENINKELLNALDFVVYEIIFNKPVSMVDQFKLIKKLGFKTPNITVIQDNNINDNIVEILNRELQGHKSKSEYHIDGIVITKNNYDKRNESGNPKYSFAYKTDLDEQLKITKVLDVKWNTSKDGYLKPTLYIEPITINNVNISKTTGFSAKFILTNKIGKGTIIEIKRSGDVIPHITRIVKCSNEPDLPSSDIYLWNKTRTDIYLIDNSSNDQYKIKNIYHFFSSLGAKDIGMKTIEKLYNHKYDTILKILNIKINDLSAIKGFKIISSENFVANINEIRKKEIKLEKLMIASNLLGRGIGELGIKQLLDNNIFDNIINDKFKITDLKLENIMKINGWDEIMSNKFINSLESFIRFYNEIKPYLIIDVRGDKVKDDYCNKVKDDYCNKVKDDYCNKVKDDYCNKVNNVSNIVVNNTTKIFNINNITVKNIVFTGWRPDDNLIHKLKTFNINLQNNITKDTNLIVAKDIDELSSKLNLAKQRKILIVSKETFIHQVNINEGK